MIGKERVKWDKIVQKIETDIKNEVTDVNRKDKNVFLYLNECLFKFQGDVVTPGEYSIPFSIALPEWLPSSFLYFGPNKANLQVSYKLRVSLVGPTPYV